MEIKTIDSFTVLYYSAVTAIDQLFQFSSIPQKMLNRAEEAGLEITGPCQWHYFGLDGKKDTKFILEICFPVLEIKTLADDWCKFKHTEQLRCVCELHRGSLYKIPDTYDILIKQIRADKFETTLQAREIYSYFESPESEKNLTEIQIGII